MRGNLFWYAVERSKVENKDFSGIEHLLKSLRKHGQESRQSLAISFSGYDHIVDEIFAIDDIRKWVGILLFKYPQILYYLDNHSASLQNILLCYGDIETVFYGEKKPAIEYTIEDYANGRVPQQQVYLSISNRKLNEFYKAIRKEANRFDDRQGATKVIDTIEEILS
jgi:hypothetical protein